MKRTMSRLMTAALIFALAICTISGCGMSGGKGEKTEHGNQTLFSYDGKDVTLKKAWIYAKMTAAQYEQVYTSYFGENFWTMEMGTDEEGNPTTFEDSVKEQVTAQIKRVLVLCNRAEEAGASLSEEEKTQCAEYAKAFAKEEAGKAILAECGGTEKDMVEIYEENALASKVQEYMIRDTDTDISEEEARKTTISRIVFATTTTDDNGATVDMKEEEKQEAFSKAQAVLAQVQGGRDIAEVAKEQEYSSVEETFAAGESEEGKAFEELLATMKDGDIVPEVKECDNGYVVARLDAYTDAAETESHRQTLLEERQQNKFKEVYDSWTAELEKEWSYKEDVNQELWAELVLHSEESTAAETTEETSPEGETEAPAAEGEATPEGETEAPAAEGEATSEGEPALQEGVGYATNYCLRCGESAGVLAR
ncbi:MAG: hypothetical protein Q4D60_08385, partial [Eubacteriales bacterium]|nr:hypothetical protein [Eubacteriales bacterium]